MTLPAAVLALASLAGFGLLLTSAGRRAPSPGAAFATGFAAWCAAQILAWLTTGALLPLDVVFAGLPAGAAALWMRRQVNWRGDARLVVLIAVAAVAYLVIARIPPANYDVLSYHLPIAVKFAEGTGAQVLGAPETFYERLPQGGAMLEALVLRGDGAPFSLAVPLFLITCALAGASCIHRAAGWLGLRRRERLLAAGLWLLHPMLLNTTYQMLTDGLVALLGIAAVELLLHAQSRRGAARLVLLAGLLAGAAAAVKLSAVGVVVAPVLVLAAFAAWHARSAGWPLLMRRGGLLAAGIALSLAPWLVRATQVGGHPMHPFRGAAAEFTEEQGRFVVEAHRPMALASVDGIAAVFKRQRAFGLELPGAGISLLLLAAIGGAFIRPRCAPLAGAALVGYVFWCGVELNPQRFLLPAVAMAVVPAAAAGALKLGPGHRPLMHWALWALVLLHGAPLVLNVARNPATYSALARRAILNGYLGGALMDVVRAADRSAGDGRILLLFEARPMLFAGTTDSRSVWDAPSWAPLLKESAEARAFGQGLRERGFSTIFVNEFEWARLVDFYGGQWRTIGGTPDAGTWRVTPRSDVLRAYPPFVFAEFGDRDFAVLAEFLKERRRAAPLVLPSDTSLQVWHAPITSE